MSHAARQVFRSAVAEFERRCNGSLGEVERAAQLIRSRVPPGRVVVSGMGKSGHIGAKVAATLASTGTPAFFVHPGEAAHGDLGMVGRQDIVLAISGSGATDELLLLLPFFKRHGIPLIALTGNPESPLAGAADLVLDGSVEQEACPLGLAPTTSTSVALALGDALAVTLLEVNGYTREDFAMTHPSGALGRRLLVLVRDIMVKDDAVPRVASAVTVREALIEMNRGGIGVTAVLDEQGGLTGIFTDGDIRRALDRNLDIYRTPVSQVMTRNPKTVQDSELAAVAPQLMERHKVTALLVVDRSGLLVGAINTRLLLQAKVI